MRHVTPFPVVRVAPAPSLAIIFCGLVAWTSVLAERSAVASPSDGAGGARTSDVAPVTKRKHAKRADATGGGVAPDDTARNEQDRGRKPQTADQQKNDKPDLEVAAAIRRAVVADKSLSTNAHNVKVIVENGHVTLKGTRRVRGREGEHRKEGRRGSWRKQGDQSDRGRALT